MKLSKQDLEEIQSGMQESSRKNRTLSLDDEIFKEIQGICAQRGWNVSRLTDLLYRGFVKAMKEQKL